MGGRFVEEQNGVAGDGAAEKLIHAGDLAVDHFLERWGDAVDATNGDIRNSERDAMAGEIRQSAGRSRVGDVNQLGERVALFSC